MRYEFSITEKEKILANGGTIREFVIAGDIIEIATLSEEDYKRFKESK